MSTYSGERKREPVIQALIRRMVTWFSRQPMFMYSIALPAYVRLGTNINPLKRIYEHPDPRQPRRLGDYSCHHVTDNIGTWPSGGGWGEVA